MLYEQSELSLTELINMQTWDYERKLEVFNSYMGERLNRHHDRKSFRAY